MLSDNVRSFVMFILLAFSLTPSACAQQVNHYEESFDIVWNTINERFYDGGFNGVDWQDARVRYRTKIIKSQNDDAFYTQINTMLFELGASHLGVVPIGDTKQLGEAAIFGEGTIGIEVRLVGDKLLITHVEDGSSAAEAGLLTGFEVLRLNGRTVAEIAEERISFPTPPFTDRNERYMTLDEIDWELLGPLEDQVLIGFKDHDGNVFERLLNRRSRGAQAVFEEGLPPTYVTFTSHRLEETIGYIKFNSFHPALLDDLADAMEQLADTKGLLIDLRGNPGGAFGVRLQLAGRFVPERTIIWRYRGRGGVDDIYLEPNERPYEGALVILVDGFSASSSEEFAGGLQSLGHATIVGERTPGRDLVADISVLPVGAYFVFPVAETQTSKGTVLERRGVIPDIEALFTQESLKEGRDIQLEVAIDEIKGPRP